MQKDDQQSKATSACACMCAWYMHAHAKVCVGVCVCVMVGGVFYLHVSVCGLCLHVYQCFSFIWTHLRSSVEKILTH